MFCSFSGIFVLFSIHQGSQESRLVADVVMTFNKLTYKEKSKTMHFGHNNGMQDYYMDGVKLSTIKEEKDLGVLITDDLKPSVQCTEAARKAMSALSLTEMV